MSMDYSVGGTHVIKLHIPSYGFMKIVQLYDQQMQTKHTPIKVTEVCSTGLNFVSFLHLPIHENVVWGFQFKIWEEEEQCEGIIVNCRKIKGGYEYETKLKKALEKPDFAVNKVLHQYAYFNEESVIKQIDLSC